MQAITTIGLDIAKSVFQVHGLDAGGKVVFRRRRRRPMSEVGGRTDSTRTCRCGRVGPQPDMGLISKRREGCKIVLLRPAVTNSISCNARFRSVRDRTNLISYIDASSLDGLAVQQPRGHWRHTPSPAQSPSR